MLTNIIFRKFKIIRKLLILFVFINISCQICHSQTLINTTTTPSLPIVAYYPTWAFCDMQPQKVDWTGITHLIWFGSEPSYTYPYMRELVNSPLGLSDSAIIEAGGSDLTGTWRGWCYNSLSDYNRNGITHLSIARDSANKYGVKLILCVGGEVGTNATIMNWIIADTIRQDVYIAHTFEYIKRKGFKGIDINLEYPTIGQRTLTDRFIRKWREKLNTMNPAGWLSFTAPAWYSDWKNRITPSVANSNLDALLIMSYGMGEGTYSGFNSPLAKPSTITYPIYDAWTWADHGPAQIIADGYSASIIVMLIPFECKFWSGVDGPGQLRTSYPSFGSYKDVLTKISQYPSGLRWDNDSKVPWLGFTEGGTKRFYSFEDSLSIYHKVQAARSYGIKGIGVWELWRGWVPTAPVGQQDPLLRYLKKAVGTNNTTPPPSPKIRGEIFFDKNQNRIKDTGEPSMAGWKIILGGAQQLSTITDSSGQFKFEQLPSGIYSVSLQIEPLWQRTLPANQSYSVLINTDTADVVCNFGAYTSNALGINLTKGWNIISLPLKVPDPRSSVLFPTATSGAFIFNGANILVDSLKNGLGFFMKFSANHKIWLAGNPILNDTITVKSGWNLLGSLSNPVPVNIISSNPPGIISSSFWVYNNTYRYADTIQPGLGYWVKVSEPGKIILQNPSLVFGTDVNYNCHFIPDSVNILKFKTPDGLIQELFFTSKASFGDRRNISKYEIPPFFSEFGIFDVRFLPENNGNPSIASVINDTPGSGEKAIQIHSINSPIELEWEILSSDSHIYEFTGPDNSVIAMTGKGSRPLPDQAEITSNDYTKIYKLAVSSQFGTGEPSSFILKQNYPNPFNGSTQISFFLPSDGYVRLDVYDVIGRIITTLVDSPKKKGPHVISFHPSENISSGIYFSRLNYITQGNLSITTNRMLYIR